MCAVAQVGPLPDDGRLNARVTVSHPVATIETLLDDLSARTGVRLKADAGVKEDLVVLRVKDVPAREVMERVASHLDWSWRAEDGGYVLFQSKEQKEREEKAYEEQFAEPLRRAQVQVKQVLQQSEGKAEELQLQYRELQRRLFAPETPPDEKQDLWWAVEDLKLRSTPLGRLALKLFVEMTPAQFRQLVELGAVVYAIRPTAAQHSMGSAEALGAEALAALTQRVPEARTIAGDLLVEFSSDEYGGLSLRGDVHFYAISPDGTVMASDYVLIPSAGAIPSKASTTLAGTVVDTPRINELLSAPDGLPYRNLASVLSEQWTLPGSDAMPGLGHGELAIALVDALELNLITDLPLAGAHGDAFRTRDAGLLLDALYPGGWSLSEGWITYRSPTWAVQRRDFIAVRTLKSLRDAFHKNGGFTLAEFGELCTRYSDAQLQGSLFGHLFDPPRRSALAAARFLYSVGEHPVSTPWNGEPILASRLSPHQRALAWRILFCDESSRSTEDYGYDFSGYVASSAASVTELLPNGLPSEAEVLIVRTEVPAVQRQTLSSTGKPFRSRWVEDVQSWLRALDNNPSYAAGLVRYVVRPARQEHVLVVVRVGDRLMGSAAITLGRWDPSVPFVSPDQLPQPIKDAIEEARRRRGGGGATSGTRGTESPAP